MKRSVTITRLTENECQTKLDNAQSEIEEKQKVADRLTGFGKYCLDSAKQTAEKMRGCLYLMRGEGKDYVYLLNGTIVPYEVGDMLFSLNEK